MSVMEYTLELHLKNLFQEGYDDEYREAYEAAYREAYEAAYREGYEEGYREGIAEINRLYSWLVDLNRIDDIMRAIDDKTFQNELFEEYRKSNPSHSK